MAIFWASVKSITLSVAPFWILFGKFGLLIIPTSGHTDNEQESQFLWRSCLWRSCCCNSLGRMSKSENSCPLTLTKAQLLTSAPRPVTAEAGNQQKAAQFCPLWRKFTRLQNGPFLEKWFRPGLIVLMHFVCKKYFILEAFREIT